MYRREVAKITPHLPRPLHCRGEWGMTPPAGDWFAALVDAFRRDQAAFRGRLAALPVPPAGGAGEARDTGGATDHSGGQHDGPV